MRIALTHPYCWPHVRRGSERNMEDHARFLVGRGHDVTSISTAPDGPREEHGASGRRILHRAREGPGWRRLRLDARHTFPFACAATLRKLRAEVVHSFFMADSLAAIATRRQCGHRVVLQLNGVAVGGSSCRRFWPPEGRMFHEAIHRADQVLACSDFVARRVARHYGRECRVIPPLLGVDRIPSGDGPKDGSPLLLSVADFTVRSKGVRLLVRAFRRLLQTVPEARLRLSGRTTPELEQELFAGLPHAIRERIEMPGLGGVDDFPGEYGRASLMVLASMGEPSGSVALESLAAGTPVVVASHGGTQEYLAPGVAALFDPGPEGEEATNEQGLLEAMLEGLQLSRRPGTREGCRERAREFFPDQLGPRYEAVYQEVLGKP